MQAVPIGANGGDQISAEARQKNCAFLLFTTQTEAITKEAHPASRDRPPISRNITPPWIQVYRVSDSTVVASGSAWHRTSDPKVTSCCRRG